MWVFGSESFAGILSKNEKITNIGMRLENMKFNGYLRLFETNTTVLMECMTESSRILFNDFKIKRHGDEWKCPQCTFMFEPNALKWKCDRCLFFYHHKCALQRKVNRKEKLKGEYSLCPSCFFKL